MTVRGPPAHPGQTTKNDGLPYGTLLADHRQMPLFRFIACAQRKPLQPFWRKPVGVEPTSDTRYRSPGLKPGPSTGQDWLPFAIVASGRDRCGFLPFTRAGY